MITHNKTMMHFPLKVYTVDSESALSQYIPFAKTRIVQYDDSSIPSELYNHTVGCLKKLEAKVLFNALGMMFHWIKH